MNDPSSLSREESIRYDRQMILPGFGREGQERLKAAKVLIVGMGGLGSPAAMYLAAAGVGTLGLADFDNVDLSNLHRQILHTTSRIGMPKVQSAALRLGAINPACRLIKHHEGIRADSLPAILDNYDIVVDCTDNFPTRYMLNDAAVLAKKPVAYGAIFQYEGQASFFNPANNAPCYRCLFPEMPDPSSVPNCKEAGVIGALCGIVGSIQAMETLKFITGVGETLEGRLLVVDSATMGIRTLAIKRDENCPVCSAKARITQIDAKEYEWHSACKQPVEPMEIHVSDFKRLLDDANPPYLLDVRDEDECAEGIIEGAINIPLDDLFGRIRELPLDRQIAVYCLSGYRSLKAVEMLRSKGFPNATSLIGGIKAWRKTM